MWRVAQLTEVGRVRHLGHLPHSPISQPETGTHDVMSANHESLATVLMRMKQNVFIILYWHASGSLSVATMVCGGSGSWHNKSLNHRREAAALSAVGGSRAQAALARRAAVSVVKSPMCDEIHRK